MIPTVFNVLETCVLVLKDKNITTQETQFIEILHTVPKCHWIVLYNVHFTAFCLGGPFFSGHGV